MSKPKLLAIVLLVVAIFATTSGFAENHIGSRDFDSTDAERLAKLATAELGDADKYAKAEVILNALEYSWVHGCGIPAAILHFPSAIDGTYLGTVPDEQSFQAVEMVYSGYNGGRVEDTFTSRVVSAIHTLEWLLPLLAILSAIAFISMIHIGLSELQERIEKRDRISAKFTHPIMKEKQNDIIGGKDNEEVGNGYFG